MNPSEQLVSQVVVPRFCLPNVEKERGEILRVAHEFGATNPDSFANLFIEGSKGVELVPLDADTWLKLENTDSFDIQPGDWENVEHHSVLGHPDHPRDWQNLKHLMEEGAEIDAPIIYQNEDSFHLVSGNTRLMVARALGKVPQVLIVKINS